MFTGNRFLLAPLVLSALILQHTWQHISSGRVSTLARYFKRIQSFPNIKRADRSYYGR